MSYDLTILLARPVSYIKQINLITKSSLILLTTLWHPLVPPLTYISTRKPSLWINLPS